jgi:threonylcarbamoyladenosine tRNA methylthiotransferase MtaB
MATIKCVKVAFDTIGCKLNQAETELLARQFTAAGYELVSTADRADIYILNTCTVTQTADSKCRGRLRLAHRQNPDALLVAVGCYAQRASHELAGIDGVGLVVDNDGKQGLLRLLLESGRIGSPGRMASKINGNHIFRTRAFIKVQDGCHGSCAYCIVPRVRSAEKSVPPEQVVSEVKQRVAEGYQEIVLTGTKIGSYSCAGTNLRGLIERILAETDVTRLRLSSLQPHEISPGLIQLWQDGGLCRHFHLSLQSGSDSMLRRMKRRYSQRDYRQAVALIRGLVSDAAITTDIIAGFPGETEAEFQESCDFCRRMEFARIHVFPYSRRPGTEAARMPDQVANNVRIKRTQELLSLARLSTEEYQQKFLARVTPVLFEKQTDGVWSGLSDNYIKVYVKHNGDLANQLVPIKLMEVYRDGMRGEVK